MMTPDTDRELLEMAAKAAGLTISAEHQARRDALIGPDRASLWLMNPTHTAWNSIRHHEDAFRLAAALYFTVAIRRHEVEVFDEDGECLCSLPILRMSMMAPGHRPDTVEDVVCRAITTAAAAMAQKPDAGDPGLGSK